MAQEPELKIKVGVEPVIKGEEVQEQIKKQVDELKDIEIPAKITLNTDSISNDLKFAVEKSLSEISNSITKLYDDISNKLKDSLNNSINGNAEIFKVDTSAVTDDIEEAGNYSKAYFNKLSKDATSAASRVQEIYGAIKKSNDENYESAKSITDKYGDDLDEFFAKYENLSEKFDNKEINFDGFEDSDIKKIEEFTKQCELLDMAYTDMLDVTGKRGDFSTKKARDNFKVDDSVFENSKNMLNFSSSYSISGIDINILEREIKLIQDYSKAVRSLAKTTATSGTVGQLINENADIKLPELPEDAMNEIVKYSNAVEDSESKLNTFKGTLEDISTTIGSQKEDFNNAAKGIDAYSDSLAKIVKNQTTDEFKNTAKEFNGIVEEITEAAKQYSTVKEQLDKYKQQQKTLKQLENEAKEREKQANSEALNSKATSFTASQKSTKEAKPEKTKEQIEVDAIRKSIVTLAGEINAKNEIINGFMGTIETIGTKAHTTAGQIGEISNALIDQIPAITDAKEEFEKYRATLSDINNPLKNIDNTSNTTSTEINIPKSGTSNIDTSVSENKTKTKTKPQKAQEQVEIENLKNTVGKLATEIDNKNEVISSFIETLKEIGEQAHTTAGQIGEISSALEKQVPVIKDTKGEINKYKTELSKIKNPINDTAETPAVKSPQTKKQEEIKIDVPVDSEIAEQYTKILKDIGNADESVIDSIERFNKALETQRDYFSSKTLNSANEYSEGLKTVSNTVNGINEGFQPILSSMLYSISELNYNIASVVENYSKNVGYVAQSVSTLGSAFDKLVSDLQVQVTAYSTIVKQLATDANNVQSLAGQISGGTAQPSNQTLEAQGEVIADNTQQLDSYEDVARKVLDVFTQIDELNTSGRENGKLTSSAKEDILKAYTENKEILDVLRSQIKEKDFASSTGLDKDQIDMLSKTLQKLDGIDATSSSGASKRLNNIVEPMNQSIKALSDYLGVTKEETDSLAKSLNDITETINTSSAAIDEALKKSVVEIFKTNMQEAANAVNSADGPVAALESLPDKINSQESRIKEAVDNIRDNLNFSNLTENLTQQVNVLKQLAEYSEKYLKAVDVAKKNGNSTKVKRVEDSSLNGFSQNIGKMRQEVLDIGDEGLINSFTTFESQYAAFINGSERSSSALLKLQQRFGELRTEIDSTKNKLSEISTNTLTNTRENIYKLVNNIQELEDELKEVEKNTGGDENTQVIARITELEKAKQKALSLQTGYDTFYNSDVHLTSEYDTFAKTLSEVQIQYRDASTAAKKFTDNIRNQNNAAFEASSSFKVLESMIKTADNQVRTLLNNNGGDQVEFGQLKQIREMAQLLQEFVQEGASFKQVSDYFSDAYSEKFSDEFGEYSYISSELARSIVNSQSYAEAMNYLRQALYNASSGVAEFKNALNNTAAEERATKRIATLKNQIQGMLSSNSRVIGTEYGNQLESLLGQLDSPTAGKNVDQIAIQVAQLRANIRAAGLEGDSLFTTIKNLFGQHLGTSAVMSSIHLLQQAFRQMYQNVVDIDSALTQVKIVTGESADVMSKFAKEAAQAAQEVGSTITDIMSSTETFARLGYSLEESTNMAKLTATFANVGDISVDDATTGITSILKGFNLEADQVEEITDKLILIARKYPIDAQGLAEALENGGAALAAAGNTLDESLALIQAGNAATQDAASVGELLRPRHSNVLSEISYNG